MSLGSCSQGKLCKIQDLSSESMWNWTWLSCSYVRSPRWTEWYLLTEYLCLIVRDHYYYLEHCVLENHAFYILFSLLILQQKIYERKYSLNSMNLKLHFCLWWNYERYCCYFFTAIFLLCSDILSNTFVSLKYQSSWKVTN